MDEHMTKILANEKSIDKIKTLVEKDHDMLVQQQPMLEILFNEIGNGWSEKIEQNINEMKVDVAVIKTNSLHSNDVKKAVSSKIKDASIVIGMLTAVIASVLSLLQ
jgi:hypothetical protein